MRIRRFQQLRSADGVILPTCHSGDNTDGDKDGECLKWKVSCRMDAYS